jgi:hypothetical protein
VRPTIDIDVHPHGVFRVTLGRIPCLNEIVSFCDPENRARRFCVMVTRVEHQDTIVGRGADALIEAITTRVGPER